MRVVGTAMLLAAAAILAGCGGSTDAEPSGAAGGGGAGGDGGTGADDAGSDADAAPSFCTGATSLVYDPLAQSIMAWPDDYWTVDDATSATGLRVKTKAGDNLVVPASAQAFHQIFDDLSTLDGFGTTAEAFLVFSGPLDPNSLPTSGDGSGKADAPLVLVDLDGATPKLLDIEVAQVAESTSDAQTTLVVSPMVPLEPKHHYGLAVTNRVKDANGGCIAPSAAMRSLLDGTASDPALSRLVPRYHDLVDRLVSMKTIATAADLSAALVFTTQHTVEDSATIAADIRTKSFAYTSSGACTAGADPSYRICEGTFGAWDYRKNHHAIDETDLTAHDPYTIPITTYLPATGTAPFPTILYGHGLNGDRHQAEKLAQLAAPEGYAVVAIDAVEHGDHPNKSGGINDAASFFGISLDFSNALDSLKLRDNFRQSTYDKLQVVELLRQGYDADGDAKSDVDLASFTYLGVSLGGIMSAELDAFVPEAKIAIPIVPGARVGNIVKDSKTFAPIVNVFKSKATDGDVARFFPMLQTVIDRGDAGAYTQHVFGARLPGFDAARPQVLMQMVIDDDTVANPENRFFARGLGVPLVGEELQHVGTIAHDPTLPISNDLDATHTGGVFQFDVVCSSTCPSPTEPATHGNVAANPVAIAQTLHFMKSFFESGTAEIIDPYATLGVKP